MTARDGRKAENQDTSRSANERLQDVAGRTASFTSAGSPPFNW
jgi:hypothetical protein